MALAIRNPGKIVSFVCEDILGDGFLVVQGTADSKVKLPAGASPTSSLQGVVYKPGGGLSSVGDVVDVVLDGIYPVLAGAGITRGALVTSNGADGSGKDESAGAGTNVGVIGQAISSGVAGDMVPCIINPFVKQGA